MTTKQWLMRAYVLNNKIDKLLEYRCRLFETACSSTSHTSKEVVSHSKSNSSEINFIKAVDCSLQVDNMAYELSQIIKEIVSAIKMVDDSKLKTLLFQRYINYKDWGEIAKILQMNVNTVKGWMHSKALQSLKTRKQTVFDLKRGK